MSDVRSQGRGGGQTPPEVDFVALKPGQKIGRYEIVAILGQGGFGITYRATDSQLNRDVAIKEYLPSALAIRQDGVTVLPRSTRVSDDFTWGRERFVDEGRTLATLGRAPAIVRVFDFLEANGTAYIVMELAPGRTLEDRLRDAKALSPAEVDRIVWPLLDGLEQVHATGFLHRDIKPANILLDDAGNPTLIDFGASRAAMAGRSTAMTAIFTPGYAAAEQMTSAKQGPWTDIYGLSATLHHAITGAPPPSAFDRMLDDEYQSIGRMAAAGFSSGLLVGIDAGLAVRAGDRPQSIAGWRPILAQSGPMEATATVALRRPVDPNATVMVRGPSRESAGLAPPAAPAQSKRPLGLWIGLGALLLVAAGGGGYFTMTKPPQQPALSVDAQAAKEARDRAELAGLRAEKEARDHAEAQRLKQVEEESRKKAEADLAGRQKADDEARQRAAADEEARKQAAEAGRRTAEAAEGALRLSTPDRQHIQVALSALGFATNGTDGVFGGHTREMISAWQKKRGDPGTGFITGAENQALLREAGPAIARFDEDQKKLDDTKKKAEETTVNVATTAAKAGGIDGFWHGTYHCNSVPSGAAFTIPFQGNVVNGVATWTRPSAGPGTTGNQSLMLRISGKTVELTRTFIPSGRTGDPPRIVTLTGRLEGNAIVANGAEAGAFGRVCDVNLTH